MPPSGTASSAAVTNGAAASGSEWTATVAIPRERQAAKIRRAISPRLATSTLLSGGATGYILKTPKRRDPSQTSPIVADSAIPSTVRVSRGSIIPSSQSSPLATNASDSASI